MQIPHKQYRQVEHSHRKNWLILSLASMVFLLTIFFSSHDFGGGMQASIVDSAKQTVTKIATSKLTEVASSNYLDSAIGSVSSAKNALSTATNFIGSDPSSLLSGAGSGLKSAATSMATDALSSATGMDISGIATNASGMLSGGVSGITNNAIASVQGAATGALNNAISGIAGNASGLANGAIGSVASSILSGDVSGIANGAIASATSMASGALSSFTSDFSGAISSVVPTNALSSLSSLSVGTLGGALNIPSLDSFTGGLGGLLGGGAGGNSMVTECIKRGYGGCREYLDGSCGSAGCAAAVIAQVPDDFRVAYLLDNMDGGNASQIANELPISQIFSAVSGGMTESNAAELMNNMNSANVVSLLGQFSPEEAIERLGRMDKSKRKEALEIMDNTQLAALANVMNETDAADLLINLELDKSAAVYDLMDKERANDVLNTLDEVKKQSILREVRRKGRVTQKIEKGAWDYAVDLFGIPSAYAADDSHNSEGIEAYYNGFLKKANDMLAFIFFFLHQVLFWPLIALLGSLVDNDFVMGGQISETLRFVWVQVRDLVNIAFVLILLIIALVTVIGSEEIENRFSLSIKSTLPKVIVAMVLVNFTFFLSKVAIDVVNVATNAIYAVPTQEDSLDMDEVRVARLQVSSCDQNRIWGCEEWRAKCYVSQGGANIPEEGTAERKVFDDNIKYYLAHPNDMIEGYLRAYGCISKVEGENGPYENCINDQKANQVNYFIREKIEESSDYFTYDEKKDEVNYTEKNLYNLERDHIICHFPMEKSDYLAMESGSIEGSTGGNLVNKGVAFTIARNFEQLIQPDKFYKNHEYGEYKTEQTPENFFTFLLNNIFTAFMFVAIFFAFLALALALVVRVVVLWVIIAISPLVVTGVVVFGKGDSILSKFINNLIIPLKVAAVFTLAFIFMSAIGNMFSPDILPTLENLYNFIIRGKDVDTGLIAPNGDSVSILQHILYLIITVGILWKGVFWAFEGTEAETLTNYVKGAGNWVLKSPQYLPIVPMPGMEGKLSFAGLTSAASGFKSTVDMGIRGQGREVGSALGASLIGAHAGENSHQAIAKESKGNADKFILEIKNDKKALSGLKNSSESNFRETLKAAGFATGTLTASNIKALQSGDESVWKNLVYNKKDDAGKTVHLDKNELREMAKSMRDISEKFNSDNEFDDKNQETLKDTSSSKGVIVATSALSATLKDIDTHLEEKDDELSDDEKDNLEAKKINTINRTVKHETEEGKKLSDAAAKDVADALLKIDKNKRDDALVGIKTEEIMKIGKAMGKKKISVENKIYALTEDGKIKDENSKTPEENGIDNDKIREEAIKQIKLAESGESEEE